jgi:mannose-6-phosphate isomerase-like protein (cupin superfamily)
MDVVDLGQLRHFLREKPIRLNLFDRSRLVCELLCLEPDQREAQRRFEASDSVVLVIEGRAVVQTAAGTRELDALEAALVPPGVEHTIVNPGPGRLTALLVTAPNPVRASEVRLPREREPYRQPRERDEEREQPRAAERGPAGRG